MLTLHQDQSEQKGKDLNEPASKGATSNEPGKKKQSSVDQLLWNQEQFQRKFAGLSGLYPDWKW